MTKEATEALDFSAYFLTETSKVEIDLPNGDPMEFNGKRVTVHVYGPSTSRFIKAKEAMDKEAMKRIVSAAAKGRKKDEEDKDADVKFLVAVTERIDNFPFPGGVEAIYRETKLKYLPDQVRGHLNDLGNFFKGGATT